MKLPSWFHMSAMALPIPPSPGETMFSKGLEVPPNWVVVPYEPTGSESQFAFHTICAWLVTAKLLNAAISDIVLARCFISGTSWWLIFLNKYYRNGFGFPGA